jgi:hypothetical protein
MLTEKIAGKREDVSSSLLLLARRSSTVYNALCTAFQMGLEAVVDQCLFHHCLDLGGMNDSNRRNLLHLATRAGRTDVVLRWLGDEAFARLAMRGPPPCALIVAVQFDRVDILEAIRSLDIVQADVVLNETGTSYEQSMLLGLALARHSETTALHLVETRRIHASHIVPAILTALESRLSRIALALLRELPDDAAVVEVQAFFSLTVRYCDTNVPELILNRFGTRIDVTAPLQQSPPDYALHIAAWRDEPELIDVLERHISLPAARESALLGAVNVAIRFGSERATLHLLHKVKPSASDLAREMATCVCMRFINTLLRSPEFARLECDVNELVRHLKPNNLLDSTDRDSLNRDWQRVHLLVTSCAAGGLNLKFGELGFVDRDEHIFCFAPWLPISRSWPRYC